MPWTKTVAHMSQRTSAPPSISHIHIHISLSPHITGHVIQWSPEITCWSWISASGVTWKIVLIYETYYTVQNSTLINGMVVGWQWLHLIQCPDVIFLSFSFSFSSLLKCTEKNSERKGEKKHNLPLCPKVNAVVIAAVTMVTFFSRWKER